jgi:hypothetical protein
MDMRRAALAAIVLTCTAPAAAAPGTIYTSLQPDQMEHLLTANGATETMAQEDGEPLILADTPVGKLEVRLLSCHEAPNFCGYVLRKRYVGLALTTEQLNRFNRRPGFAHAYRPPNSKDVVLAYAVSLGKGVDERYIVSTFALLTGVSEVFEVFVTDTLHVNQDRIHAE